jgi:hypothetical protein
MELSSYVAALRADLAAAAAAGGEASRQAADLLATALEPAVRLVLMDAIADAAAEVTTALDDVTVDVRLRGREPELVIAVADRPPSEPAPSPDVEEGTARVTLRLPETVKTNVEAAAASQGISVNTWVVRAVTRELDPPTTRRAGRRTLTGYARG